ncbi:MAG TPA: hypothetical protein VK694_04215 [Verrucomicrobiae bacterium]|nr:hypothetical protein [Verrucomicrobiae bacterium]
MTRYSEEGDGEQIQTREGVEFLRRGAEQYAQDNGLVVPDVDFSNIVADPVLGRQIGAAYEVAPYFDPAAFPAYSAFSTETAMQFYFLTSAPEEGGLGIEVKGSDSDPYHDADSRVPNIDWMMDDLCNHRLRILVSKESEIHLMDPVVNTMFRAVHEAFGHAAIGCGFDPDGEEAAWYAHSHLYSPLARRALTTETRGQQNALLYDSGEGLPLQKFCLLLAEFANLDTVTFRTTAREI